MRFATLSRIAILTFGLGWCGAVWAQAQPAPTPPATSPAAPAQPAPAEAPVVIDLAELLQPGPLPENSMGSPDAKITIVEYASLTCPHCANFHNNTLPAFKKAFIDTGRVRLVFRDFPFDMVAMAGSMLARCAPKEQFFDLTATLFKNQEKWAFADDPEKNLRELAYQAGFTQETFDACLQRQEIYDGILAGRKRGHEVFKVDSTPTLFINGVMYRGSLSPPQLDAAIRPLLDK